MTSLDETDLSMRERQIMEVVHRLQPVTVQQVRGKIPDPPTANAVRTMLGNLVEKGYLKRDSSERRATYTTRQKRETAARSALRKVVRVFFGGSLERVVATYLADPKSKLSAEETVAIREMLDEAERRRRRNSR